MQTFSFGTTPEALITAACKEQCPDGYPMTIRSDAEWSVIAACVNAGIDARLEALTERSTFDASTGECNVHPEELHVLLRRLANLNGDDTTVDDAFSLRSAILFTLDIEEI